jgi:hypothetical protein
MNWLFNNINNNNDSTNDNTNDSINSTDDTVMVNHEVSPKNVLEQFTPAQESSKPFNYYEALQDCYSSQLFIAAKKGSIYSNLNKTGMINVSIDKTRFNSMVHINDPVISNFIKTNNLQCVLRKEQCKYGDNVFTLFKLFDDAIASNVYIQGCSIFVQYIKWFNEFRKLRFKMIENMKLNLDTLKNILDIPNKNMFKINEDAGTGAGEYVKYTLSNSSHFMIDRIYELLWKIILKNNNTNFVHIITIDRIINNIPYDFKISNDPTAFTTTMYITNNEPLMYFNYEINDINNDRNPMKLPYVPFPPSWQYPALFVSYDEMTSPPSEESTSIKCDTFTINLSVTETQKQQKKINLEEVNNAAYVKEHLSNYFKTEIEKHYCECGENEKSEECGENEESEECGENEESEECDDIKKKSAVLNGNIEASEIAQSEDEERIRKYLGRYFQ